MAKKFTVKFTGASHKEYSFYFYDYKGDWKEVMGIYLIGRYDQNKNTV